MLSYTDHPQTKMVGVTKILCISNDGLLEHRQINHFINIFIIME